MHTVDFHNQVELIDGFRHALDADRDVLLRSAVNVDPTLEFAQSVSTGLERPSPQLDCRFLYDAQGSELYEQICEQPEYYLTRAEDEILARHGAELREITGPVRLLELGSGTAVKTDHLLSAWLDRAPEAAYVPVDVSESALRKAGRAISEGHDGVRFVGVNATYEEALPLLGQASPVMLMFMGSTLGNLDEPETQRFWERLRALLRPGDFFLLGIDLVKDSAVIETAYNDAAGLTARFTLNLFERMNRELGSAVDVGTLTHEAHYDEGSERVKTFVRFNEAQTIEVAPTGSAHRVEAGSRVLVEISRKFHVADLSDQLRRTGLERVAHFTDAAERFALCLFERTPGPDDH